MSSATLVSVSEYIATSYRPDRDYIDGQILERNVGERDHSWIQGEILLLLAQYRKDQLFAFPEQRIQVKPTRFRIPDISVTRGFPQEQIFTAPPSHCIEALSPDDSLSSMQERIDDYLTFGVENIWIVDLRRKRAFWVDKAGIHEASRAILEAIGAPIRMDLPLLWSARAALGIADDNLG